MRGSRKCRREMAASLLACGVDPRRSALFVQSHVRPTRAWSGGGLTARTARCAQVREHTELAWVLGCATPMGWLQRMTQFKAKGGGKSNLGLFSYPVLMAADVLLYRATGDSPAPARLGGVTTSPLRRPCADVPVGDDQRQHLELAQLIAGSFNAAHGQVFTVPKGIFAAGARRARPPPPLPPSACTSQQADAAVCARRGVSNNEPAGRECEDEQVRRGPCVAHRPYRRAGAASRAGLSLTSAPRASRQR